MNRILSFFFAVIAWFAVLAQYYLMIKNYPASIAETTIRFFSFFTILTNLLVAAYFTLIAIKTKSFFLRAVYNPGTLTAITTYITVVGLVYQIILRPLWEPKGFQRIVDEMLHSLIPVLVILYWYLYENKSLVSYKSIPKWLIYPLIYLICILVRGQFFNFYPYPFINVTNIGLSKVILNSLLLTGLFVALSAIFIKIGRTIKSNVNKPVDYS